MLTHALSQHLRSLGIGDPRAVVAAMIASGAVKRSAESKDYATIERRAYDREAQRRSRATRRIPTRKKWTKKPVSQVEAAPQ